MRLFRLPLVIGGLAISCAVLGGIPAVAAQAASAQPARVAAQAASAPTAHALAVSTAVSVANNARNSAGDPCRTVSYTRYQWDVVTGARITSFTMHTYFCYNHKTVTSHTTWETGNVTQVGGLEGWSYTGHSKTLFHCYVAAGSKKNCSGNYETAQGHFNDCFLHYGCVGNWNPTIQMWENYKGQWFYGN